MSGSLAEELIVELEHVHVARGMNAVLHDVSLAVRRGEHLAIVGPNGCGKSTLLKAMTYECYPLVREETRVRVFGRERWDRTELQRKMGVVTTEAPPKAMRQINGYEAALTGFFSSSTLWPNLQVTEAMRDRAVVAMQEAGASHLAEKLVGEMSAGEQRRVLIARALAGASGDGTGSVEMLVLDEPTNALDLAAQHDLRETLRRLAQRGVAIVMVTHHTADVLPEMERVVMMREGRIVADGRKREMLTAERLSVLFGRAIAVTEREGYLHAW